MKIYMSGRQTGKTTKLVKLSAETGATIVVANHSMGKNVELVAQYLGLDIPTPITVVNYIKILAKDGLGKTKRYLVDELQMMLHQMNVETATVDENCITNLEHDSLLERATKAESENILLHKKVDLYEQFIQFIMNKDISMFNDVCIMFDGDIYKLTDRTIHEGTGRKTMTANFQCVTGFTKNFKDK